MKKRTSKSAAIVTIHGPGNMHLRGRKAIAAWLKRTADDLVNLGAKYTDGRFTARYLYEEEL